ncbi:MAG: hypothetical protein ACOZNI_35510 [Myxococcota bacterium]
MTVATRPLGKVCVMAVDDQVQTNVNTLLFFVLAAFALGLLWWHLHLTYMES